MRKLYRLKSNRNTIVEKEGLFARVFWTESMEKGCADSSWMRALWQDENVEELSENETSLCETKREEYRLTRI